MFKKEDRSLSRKKRHLRVRKKLLEQLRDQDFVFRSENIYAQIIDDVV